MTTLSLPKATNWTALTFKGILVGLLDKKAIVVQLKDSFITEIDIEIDVDEFWIDPITGVAHITSKGTESLYQLESNKFIKITQEPIVQEEFKVYEYEMYSNGILKPLDDDEEEIRIPEFIPKISPNSIVYQFQDYFLVPTETSTDGFKGGLDVFKNGIFVKQVLLPPNSHVLLEWPQGIVFIDNQAHYYYINTFETRDQLTFIKM
jgi:hypothetical protein